MSTTPIARHYARIIAKWPADPLRPALSFQKALAAHQKSATTTTTTTAAATQQQQNKDVNALYSLLDDRYKRAYPLSARFLKPNSKASYYDDLVAELEQSTHRNWWQGFVTKLKARLRFDS
ncbi:hypothetical protein IWX90DRAFT_483183 [Phyllosticta citrichinensis]|uniref:Uncharacterized protein n=1 Tax=Phyllosticta citrichinensis TaxID=1130410 RepID=A0ABR1Y1L5_9PEZI